MLNLNLGDPHPDHFYHLQAGEPVYLGEERKCFGLLRIRRWGNLFLPDGSLGTWVSYWWLGNALYYYRGTCKCDGTRTRMYWSGQLDDGQPPPYVPDPKLYVMTTTKKEMFSVRFFIDPNEPNWDSMGGS